VTRRNWTFLAGGVLVALALACIVSFWASSKPDGLEKVATDQGIAVKAEDHDLADSPLADYGTKGVDDERLSVAIAGATGVGLTLVLGGGLFWVVSRSARRSDTVS
jgi:cobalt/nickel transport system permease protein